MHIILFVNELNETGRESEKLSDLRKAEKQMKCLQDTTSCHPSRACSTTKPSKVIDNTDYFN